MDYGDGEVRADPGAHIVDKSAVGFIVIKILTVMDMEIEIRRLEMRKRIRYSVQF